MFLLWPFSFTVNNGMTKSEKISKMKIAHMEEEIGWLKKEQRYLEREQEMLKKIDELTNQLAEQNK